MKTTLLTAALLLLAGPACLRAGADIDRKIEIAARESYNYRTVLEDHVTVKVADGIVTLTGTVKDADHRVLAEHTVRDLPGVVRVDNQIKVQAPAAEQSDGWIATKVRTKLLVKGNVSATNTSVNVKEGVVTLTGTAESTAQKELTAAYVKEITGVKSVVNNLKVTPPADPRTFGNKVDDASITAQVKYALLTHKSTSALNTGVSTKNGVITITGTAGSDAEKALVSQLASTVRGVQSVNNQMTVKG
jgi:hyperosmotically inducible protein